jgi:transcription initiation factor TFIID TATA-box-binding protein
LLRKEFDLVDVAHIFEENKIHGVKVERSHALALLKNVLTNVNTADVSVVDASREQIAGLPTVRDRGCKVVHNEEVHFSLIKERGVAQHLHYILPKFDCRIVLEHFVVNVLPLAVQVHDPINSLVEALLPMSQELPEVDGLPAPGRAKTKQAKTHPEPGVVVHLHSGCVTLRICNVVATADVNCYVSFAKILAQEPEMASYNPARFSGILIRREHPRKSHCRLYANGKITVNGAVSEEGARELAEQYCMIVRGYGYPTARLSAFRVVNMVASADLGRRVDLERASAGVSGSCFVPELFPGLSLRLSKATCVVFRSGKCNVLGAKSEAAVLETIRELVKRCGL